MVKSLHIGEHCAIKLLPKKSSTFGGRLMLHFSRNKNLYLNLLAFYNKRGLKKVRNVQFQFIGRTF